MREINVNKIIKVVKEMSMEANFLLPEDVKNKIQECKENETWPIGKNILGKILLNVDISKNEEVPMCQDTGMICLFVDIGQEVHIEGGNLEDALNEGIRQGYKEGYLRKSIVIDPLRRVNTKDNTPGVIYYSIVPGDIFAITLAPKGFGSENMSQLKMMKPSDGVEGIKEFVLQVIKDAGPNPCPPTIVGIGIGGTFDRVALLAKKALIRPIDVRNPDKFYSKLEDQLLESINNLGIGPQGFGGNTTALAVNIETYPTHIAGLPVAVNINCHVSRHVSRKI